MENINTSFPNDGLGDKVRNAFNKVNLNFTELYNNKVNKITGKGLSTEDYSTVEKALVASAVQPVDLATVATTGNYSDLLDIPATFPPSAHTHIVSEITDFPTFKTIEGQSVIGAGNIDLDKNSVGLGNVDNTSDLNKIISTATQTALNAKAPISSVHNPVTIGTANGLSLDTQQLSLGLASSGVTGALSGTDWNTFNNKVGGSGSTNFLTKWSGTNTVNASGAWRETSNRLANAADNGSSDFQVTGQIDLKSKNTQGDGGQLGAELLTTGTGDASWTGTSFATGYTHATGSVTTLTSALAPVINNLYQVAYTVTGRTAGSFTIAFGGATTAGITSSSAVGHRASTTGTLVITPTSDFNGTIVLSIKQITAGTASFVFRDNGGTIRSELRILGFNNTANGTNSLRNNTTGTSNTANGVNALPNNTTGFSNTANGVNVLQNNTTGGNNTASGVNVLLNNTTGGGNTASGLNALLNNTTGNNNTANGISAGRFISNGATSLTVANNSTFLGANTKALADNSTNETVVGDNAIGDGNNTVSIGSTSVVSSRLRGRLLQGGVVDNLIDSGQFSGNVLATGFKTASGTASQFLKANGSVDSNTYLTSASLPTVDQTIIDGSTNAVSGNAVFDVLATKFPTPTGLTTNYLPKWNGSGFGNSQIFDNGANVGIGTTTPNVKFDVAGVIRSSFIDSYPSIEAFNQGTVGFPLFQLRNIKNSVEKFWNIENGRTINGDLGFYNEGGQRITFTTNGRVLINKTDDDLTNQLQVAGTISASPATTANQVVVKSQLDAVSARPYKVYTALLTQIGNAAPTATVLENTLGGTVVWSYVSIGQYRGTLTGAFLANKTVVFLTNVYGEYFLTGGRENDNSVIIGTQAPNGGSTNGDLSNSSIEIRVYL